MVRNWGGSSTGRNGGGGVRRRSFLRAAGVGVAGVGLAGCTSGGTEGTTTGTPTDAGVPDRIRVGVLAPSPKTVPTGASIVNSARLAVEHLNQDGGIAGATVELEARDTQGDPETGRQEYLDLVEGEGVDVTMGIFTSEVLLNVMDDIAASQTVHLTAGAGTPEVSAMVHEDYDRYRYHFRAGPMNGYQFGLSMVDFAAAKLDDLGWESVAVLVEDYQWTEPVYETLTDHLDGANLEVVSTNRYGADTQDFTGIYDSVEASGADAAYVAMAHTGNAAIVQWAKQRRQFEFGGIHVPMQLPQYYEAVGGACAYGVTLNVATPQSELTEYTLPYVNAYRDAFGHYPAYTGYIAYDAVKQYAAAVSDRNSVAADEVITGLESSSYTGCSGTIEYYPPRHAFAHDVVYDKGRVWPIYQQWQADDQGNGVQEVIWPDDVATATYEKPPWIQGD